MDRIIKRDIKLYYGSLFINLDPNINYITKEKKKNLRLLLMEGLRWVVENVGLIYNTREFRLCTTILYELGSVKHISINLCRKVYMK